MEKRKVFKISIIDKEISRIEFDRNTFYTSDSELTLVFKLIEKDYTYENGEILLYNEDDKSFVTREITKQENDFVYELDLDIIPHYGTWKAQLQLVNDGDVYTSKPFEFSIVNDLSNLAPQPTLTDINNWSTLKQSAAELIDEMQDIIVDVESAESERAIKENLRQKAESERVIKENIRQNSELKRENQENTRQNRESKRENNEKQRRIAEFERVDKENTRQQAESQRQSTFESNESERQSTFKIAENDRVSAESSRVSAEEQRKIDHANRSAELAGKADKVVLKNELVNPNFSDGLIGWDRSIENESVVNGNEVTITTTSEGRYGLYQINNQEGLKYISAEYYSEDKIGSFTLGNTLVVTTVPNGIWTRVSTVNSDKGLIRFYADSGLDKHYKMRKPIIINITKTFGAGNEPTKEEMDELIKVTGYIDDEYALNNKEMLIWTLALIRRNKNAIITLGGTI